jgi:hypothetical protein
MHVESLRLFPSPASPGLASRVSFSPAQTDVREVRPLLALRGNSHDASLLPQAILAILLATATVTNRAGLRSSNWFAQMLTLVCLRRV